jgi:acyl-CoA dehydrogenase
MSDAELIQELRSTVRAFVKRELEPLEAKMEIEDRFPEGLWERMAQLGYFGLTIPVEYGGAGLSISAYCAVVEEFGRTSGAFFSIIDDNNGMGSELILRTGSEELRQRILPELASGKAIGCFALTEPGAGSDAAGITTLARRERGQAGDGYVLNGRKHFISNACWAKYFTVITRSKPLGDPDPGYTAFAIERDTPGFTIGRREPMMGMRGACQHELNFDDCFVPVACRLGEEGAGLKHAYKALILGRLVVSSWSIGAADRALEMGINYARDRVQFGHPIGTYQGVQWLVADSATELFASRAMLREVTAAADAGTARAREASMVKLFATEMAGRVVDRMLQIHGGAGYAKDLPIERIYRDVRVQRIIEGTSEIQRMIIAKSLLKEAGLRAS